MRKNMDRPLIDHLQISQCSTDVFYFVQRDLKFEMCLMDCMKYISNIKYFVKDFTEELRSVIFKWTTAV